MFAFVSITAYIFLVIFTRKHCLANILMELITYMQWVPFRGNIELTSLRDLTFMLLVIFNLTLIASWYYHFLHITTIVPRVNVMGNIMLSSMTFGLRRWIRVMRQSNHIGSFLNILIFISWTIMAMRLGMAVMGWLTSNRINITRLGNCVRRRIVAHRIRRYRWWWCMFVKLWRCL